jgi:hypothetical protein
MAQRCVVPSKKLHAPSAARAAIVPSSNGMVHPAWQQAPE